MSANNYLEIKKDGKEYVISDLGYETGLGHELIRKKSLKVAIRWAEEYQQDIDHVVEYGIHFNGI